MSRAKASAFTLSRREVNRRTAPAVETQPGAAALPPRTQVDVVRTAVVHLKHPEQFVREISKLWREAQHSFLAIGRYLVQAKESLPHGSYQTMVDESLPFGRQVAYEFRMVAEAVDGGRLPEPKLPHSSSVAYQLATLKADELAEASKAGLIRPDLRRPEIIAWKRERARFRAGPDREAAERLRAKVIERIRRHEADLEKARAELAALDEALGHRGRVIDGEAVERPS